MKRTDILIDEDYTLEDEIICDELNFAKDFKMVQSPEPLLDNNNKKKKVENPHKGHRERMYERYETTGFDGFHEHEVLEMLLYRAVPYKDTNKKAHMLLDKFGSLVNVLEADADDLVSSGLTLQEALIITQYREVNNYIRLNKAPYVVLSNVDVAGEFCCDHFGYDIIESLYLISMDASRKIKAITRISKGNESHTDADIKKMIRVAVRHRARAIILCHNHPGGNLNPSPADVNTTNKLIDVFQSMDIIVVDHIICNKTRYLSMFDSGSLTL